MSSESSSPRTDSDSARDNEYRLSEVRQVTREDGSVETRKERKDRLAQRRSNLDARPTERQMEMVGATAIELTAFVRSRILNLFVRFVRFVVKHPVSGPHAIGPGCFSTGRMPRTAGASVDDMWYHVLNRGNPSRGRLFARPLSCPLFSNAI
jgi:hypothetical protein